MSKKKMPKKAKAGNGELKVSKDVFDSVLGKLIKTKPAPPTTI